MIQVKSAKEIVKMMKAGELAAKALEFAGQNAVEGISTWELDKMVNDFVVSHRGHSPCKGYGGFPGYNCYSVNEELIHGIPSKTKILKAGDILSCDIVAELDGYMGDNTKTFRIGQVSDEKEKLLQATETALYKGIEQAVKGNRIGDIGYAIQSCVEGAGYFVVKRFIGHGIGKEMHEDPEVPNYGHQGRGARLIPGMTIAIEPMVNQTTENIRILEDGWTVLEGNNKMSAHFEHTVLITEDKPVILTLTSH